MVAALAMFEIYAYIGICQAIFQNLNVAYYFLSLSSIYPAPGQGPLESRKAQLRDLARDPLDNYALTFLQLALAGFKC